ncbi:hypothetical protein ACLB2K_023107 [Fragaria x ananassa]
MNAIIKSLIHPAGPGLSGNLLNFKGFPREDIDILTGDSVVNVGESVSSTNVPSHAMDMEVSVPFALVDEIADASPAAEDGIQFGDQFVKFGNVKNGDNLLRKIASGAQSGLCCACYGLKARCTIRLNGDT